MKALSARRSSADCTATPRRDSANVGTRHLVITPRPPKAGAAGAGTGAAGAGTGAAGAGEGKAESFRQQK